VLVGKLLFVLLLRYKWLCEGCVLQLCPNFNVIGCAYTKEGSFNEGDIITLPGRGDKAPAINIWDEFLQVCGLSSCTTMYMLVRQL
jgi:hypothetical protein